MKVLRGLSLLKKEVVKDVFVFEQWYCKRCHVPQSGTHIFYDFCWLFLAGKDISNAATQTDVRFGSFGSLRGHADSVSRP
jgi:hypothetical protein